jgi:hypothetical protein
MTPRSSACILLDMETAKIAFDAQHFGNGQALTRVYKVSLQAEWRTFNSALVPLMHELEAARKAESKARITRMLQVAARPAWFE